MLDVDTGAVVRNGRKVCPMMSGPCLESDCAWWIYNNCALVVIAARLDALITGVPVYRMFEDYEEGS